MRGEFKDEAICINSPQSNWNFTFYYHLCMILHNCTGLDSIIQPGWEFRTVIWKPKCILINSSIILLHTSISNYDRSSKYKFDLWQLKGTISTFYSYEKMSFDTFCFDIVQNLLFVSVKLGYTNSTTGYSTKC